MAHIQIPIQDGLFLKSWDDSEAPVLFAFIDENREYLSAWLPWVSSVRQVSDSLDFITSSATREFGIWYHENLVGCIGLHEVNTLHKKTSIGYWLGSKYAGKGIMTKAVKALTTYCFEDLGLNRVEIRVAEDNKKSNAVARRLWFKKEGTLRQAELINGEFVDDIVYSMLKKDWISSRV